MFQNVLYFGTTTVATESGEKVWRATGTFEDPNMTASFIMVGVIFCFAILLFSKTRLTEKLFLIFTIGVSFVGIFSTFSRSGLVTVVLGVLILLFFLENKKIILLVLVGVVATILGFIFLSPYGEFLTSRSLSIFDVMQDPSIRNRIYMAVSSFWMFIDNPLFGIGFRGYPMLYDFYIHPKAPQILLYVKESHTLWATLLAELGIIGFSIVVFWFKRIFMDSYRLTRSLSDFEKVMAIGSFVLFVSFNINFLFYGNMFPHFNLIWLNLAIIYSLKLKFAEKK
jgi:O-antigen ligase